MPLKISLIVMRLAYIGKRFLIKASLHNLYLARRRRKNELVLFSAAILISRIVSLFGLLELLKSQRPFTTAGINIENLNCFWRSNRKAWMIGDIFKE